VPIQTIKPAVGGGPWLSRCAARWH